MEQFQRVNPNDRRWLIIHDRFSSLVPNNDLDNFRKSDGKIITNKFPDAIINETCCKILYKDNLPKRLFDRWIFGSKSTNIISIIITKFKDEWYHVTLSNGIRNKTLCYLIDQRDQLSEFLDTINKIIPDHKKWWDDEYFRIIFTQNDIFLGGVWNNGVWNNEGVGVAIGQNAIAIGRHIQVGIDGDRGVN